MFALLLTQFILAIWALVANASTECVLDKCEIGISSGYGGAFSYVPALSTANNNKYLVASTPPLNVNPSKKLSSSVPISNGYGGAYGYTSNPIITVNKDLPSIQAISNDQRETSDHVPTLNVENQNQKLLPSLAVSSGYGRAYSYASPASVINVNNDFKSDLAFPNIYNEANGLTLPSSAANTKNDLHHGIAISSGYGGAYGYNPTTGIVDVNKDLMSNNAMSGNYVGVYSPTSTVSDKNVNVQVMKKPDVMIEDKVVPMPSMLIYLPGYSGYGNRISSHSGYSRYPGQVGYGFAYANGWL